MKLSLFWLVGCFLLSACNNSQLDKLSNDLGSDQKTNQRGRTYILLDTDRNQYVAIILSARSINPGEVVGVGDDLWSVQGAQILTAPVPAVEGSKLPRYRAKYTRLIVKSLGKAPVAPVPPELN